MIELDNSSENAEGEFRLRSDDIAGLKKNSWGVI